LLLQGTARTSPPLSSPLGHGKKMTAVRDRRNSVFISYTHSDRRFVERLAGDLRLLGCEVWLDEWKVRVGDSLLKEVGNAITYAKWMVIVISPAAMASEWVNTELRTGLARGRQMGT